MSKREAKPTKPIAVTSLSVLQEQCDKPLQIEIKLDKSMDPDERSFTVTARRLRPKEEAELRNLIDVVVPPFIKGAKAEDDRPNFNDPDYILRKNQVENETRAMAIYWCVPIFSEEKPGLTNRKEICDFVNSKLNDTLLNVLFLAVREGGVSLAELVNFT